MAGVNNVTILGRMGRDPETSYLSSGTAVCKFSLATSHKKKDGTEITAWHRLTAFGKTAELVDQYVKKGDQLYVAGMLSYGQYEKDGIKRFTTDIIVNQLSFISGSKSGQNNHRQQQSNNTNSQNQQYPMNGMPDHQNTPSDDIPF